VRLNKLLSHLGIASRRAADELIRQGRVELNGHVVTELGTKAEPDRDEVKVDGRRVGAPQARRYLLLNKPRNVMSTRHDPQRRPTVIDLLAQAGITGFFYPVGRLDFDSEGLMLLTNDGTFADRVTHPRAEIERTYEARIAGEPDARDLDRLRRGVPLDGHWTLPAAVRVVHVTGSGERAQTTLEITIREGRNRQIRRMCDAIAHPVDRLRRTRIGSISDPRLKPGQLRDLTPAEVSALMRPSPSKGPKAGAAKPNRGDRRRKPAAGATSPAAPRSRTARDAKRRRPTSAPRRRRG
jgi:pseudouridine synthase